MINNNNVPNSKMNYHNSVIIPKMIMIMITVFCCCCYMPCCCYAWTTTRAKKSSSSSSVGNQRIRIVPPFLIPTTTTIHQHQNQNHKHPKKEAFGIRTTPIVSLLSSSSSSSSSTTTLFLSDKNNNNQDSNENNKSSATTSSMTTTVESKEQEEKTSTTKEENSSIITAETATTTTAQPSSSSVSTKTDNESNDDDEYEYIEYEILTETEFINSEWLIGTNWNNKPNQIDETWVRLIVDDKPPYKNVAIWGDNSIGTWNVDVASQFVSISKENKLAGKEIWACTANDYYYLQGTVRGWKYWTPASVLAQWQGRRLNIDDKDEAGIPPWFQQEQQEPQQE